MKILRTSLLCLVAVPAAAQTLAPSAMPKVGTVSPRFQSYNVEMVEVTGGRFWKPFDAEVEALLAAPKDPASTPAGMDPRLYEYRKPIDLTNPRLRKLAAALGPAYVRVSGTWQNSTYFQNTDAPAPAKPPAGFNSVLTRAEWKGVIDFAHATDAEIVSSFATSMGTRDASGLWTPTQAAAFLDYTRSIAGRIAAAEFMNEPTFAVMGGATKGYDGAAYARDFAVFLPFIRKADPRMIVLGPGGVAEGGNLKPVGMPMVSTESILKATGPVFDAFSYHFYGAASRRCGISVSASIEPEHALDAEWLDRTNGVLDFYTKLRDQYVPGKPIWLNETAQAACGGDKFASTYIDSFRYLNQLGTLARHGVQVVAHNTLASSDYGLIDEKTMTPRPNYWAALLWHRTMGTTVLDPGPSPSPAVRLYAHCENKVAGGVSLLVLNTDRTKPQSLTLPVAAGIYTLSAASLDDKTVLLNGKPLEITARANLPSITAQPAPKGTLTVAPATIAFVTMPTANNPACKAQ